MTENPISFSRQFKPPGLAGQTSAPANVEEQDLPPGAPPYYGGPLANPKPSPTPAPNSLTTLANGGTNHQEAWMAGQPAPQMLPEQKPFAATDEQDLPPGAPPYYGGPLANPKPTPTPDPKKIAHFSWSSVFEQQPAY